MSALIERHYTNLRQIPAFYADRALRIVPQFWFYLIIAVIALKLGLLRSNMFISTCTTPRIVSNFSVLMLEFGFFKQLWKCMPLPQTWSLGLEAWFYLIVPFILAFRLRGAATLISTAVFLCAYLGVIKTNLHGYYLLDGTLFIFMIGSFIYTRRNLMERVIPWIFWGGAMVALLLTFRFPAFDVDYNRSVLVGLLFAIPMLRLLSKFEFSRWDEFAGNISYGVFLNHVLINWVLPQSAEEPWRSPSRLAIVLASSLLLSTISYLLIERPSVMMRRAIRYKRGSGKSVKPFPTRTLIAVRGLEDDAATGSNQAFDTTSAAECLPPST